MIDGIKEIINEDIIKYSLYVEDLNKEKKLYSYNINQKVSSASIIKIFIMGEAYNQMNKGKILLEKRANISQKNIVKGSIIRNLSKNDYSINDLIFLMINLSDNIATNQLIDILGMKNINNFIKKVGLENTVLNRKMMDFKMKEKGLDNITTVEDVSIFLRKLYNGEIINKDISKEILHIMKKQLDNRMMSRNIDKSITKISHKTGDLDRLNHDSGIIYTKDTDYIFTMFTWDGIDNLYGRKLIGEVSEKIYNYITKNYDD